MLSWLRRTKAVAAPWERPIGAAGDGGFGAPFHIVYERQSLPDAGAMQYSYETLALPRYTAIGNGVANQRGFLPTPNKPVQQLQGITLQSLGAPGIPAGNMYTQPLFDADTVPNPSIQQGWSTPDMFAIPTGGLR